MHFQRNRIRKLRDQVGKSSASLCNQPDFRNVSKLGKYSAELLGNYEMVNISK